MEWRQHRAPGIDVSNKGDNINSVEKHEVSKGLVYGDRIIKRRSQVTDPGGGKRLRNKIRKKRKGGGVGTNSARGKKLLSHT